MAYENFKNQDLRALKIVQNARKFDVEILQNEAIVKSFLNSEKMELNESERLNIEEIFKILMKIEEDTQLSK
ncbi:acetyltransferase [Campylobacter curvus]|uniref:acetyltransferase n=1 Tax=Campylobacter curvus TaxID=200 RepID=UPI0014707EFF|nr:acetyltransferase [Campylobacter curvus]MBN7289108.1 acetyltransferase [Campylobacter curvus]MDU6826824.1 acetyltransferase [Campylobacter sp.]